ncbi:MAG: hypothetical protein Q9190_006142 [Brigantiaea leucoxantha]
MGVLVGTSLIVIIPEGVDTLYSAEVFPHTHDRRSVPDRQIAARWQSKLPTLKIWRRDDSSTAVIDPSPINTLPGPVIPADDSAANFQPDEPPGTPTAPGEAGILESNSDSQSSQPSPSSSPTPKEGQSATSPPSTPPSEPARSQTRTPHAWIGLSLILGFILMYLLDTLPLLSPSPTPRPSQNIYSLSDLSSSPPPSSNPPSRPFSTTLGLCIHAAADGIALGASHSSASTTSLGLIIFLAIMIHKAPASFGLTSVLLKQGLGKRGARAHLVVFSLAAPAGAVATWVVVRALGGGGGGEGEEASMRFWTGVLLLFSGGTFLYVAMHTMQESDTTSISDQGFGNGYLDSGGGHHLRNGSTGGGEGDYESGTMYNNRQTGNRPQRRSFKLVAAAVGGMLLPLITQVGHAH